MFIVESADDSYINESFGLPEITDWSDDSYNILESSLFFEEDMSRIIKATAVAEVMSYNEGTIESFNEGVASTVWNKIKQLWEKLKAFLKKVRDRFMAWIRKTFMSSESFFSKYKTVIKDNMSKLERKNPKISVPSFVDANTALNRLGEYYVKNRSFTAGANHKLGSDATDNDYIDKYNDICEEIDDIVDDFNKELDRTSEENIKDIKMADGSAITTAVVGDKPIKEYNDKHKELETDVKNCEKQLKPMLKSGYVDPGDKKLDDQGQPTKDTNEKASIFTKRIVYNVKIAKKALTAKHNGTIALCKAEVKAMTKVAYEAVKLQNTKEEDIKEESASIDLLNKYLQRI